MEARIEDLTECYEVRMLYRDELAESLKLAWKTFLEFEAPEYEEEGIKNFYNFITDPILGRMFLLGEYQVWGAFKKGKMIGMAGLRNSSHISLLFVDKEFHCRGVATNILKQVFIYCKEENRSDKITVNSSPYAVGFYHKTGFKDTDGEITKDGIRYTPMLRSL